MRMRKIDMNKILMLLYTSTKDFFEHLDEVGIQYEIQPRKHPFLEIRRDAMIKLDENDINLLLLVQNKKFRYNRHVGLNNTVFYSVFYNRE